MPLLILAILFGLLLPEHVRAQDTPSPLTRIAFGSCADEEKPQPIWDAVLAYQPQLFLFTGDNVYGDVRQGRNVPDAELLQSLQESYAQAGQVPGMARLRSTIPHLATWDDHDYGKNDAGADFIGRHEAQRLFLQFWNVPLADVRHRREGVYHSQTFGPSGQRVQVILLDTRFFRSPPEAHGPTQCRRSRALSAGRRSEQDDAGRGAVVLAGRAASRTC